MALSSCSAKTLMFIFAISAIPFAYIISLQLSKPITQVYQYHSSGNIRECARWDDSNRRFIISLGEGGIGQVSVPDDYSPGTVLNEVPLIKDVDWTGNTSNGIVIDRLRNRLLVVITDAFGKKKPRYCALAAYDLSTLKRLFLTQINGPGEDNSLADDVAVDAEANAYVTDVYGNKIWKVGEDGEFLSIIASPLFTPKEWYKSLLGLNGIVYHPDGFLIAVHTSSGNLFKIDIRNKEVKIKLIAVAGGPLLQFGDGLLLLHPTNKLVVAGVISSARLVESSDGWETASVVAIFNGLPHRFTTSATVKDGRVYLNHMFGLGYPKKKHVLVEAVF